MLTCVCARDAQAMPGSLSPPPPPASPASLPPSPLPPRRLPSPQRCPPPSAHGCVCAHRRQRPQGAECAHLSVFSFAVTVGVHGGRTVRWEAHLRALVIVCVTSSVPLTGVLLKPPNRALGAYIWSCHVVNTFPTPSGDLKEP
eukprot:5622084-Prymnesium_polylepis.1